MTLSLFVLVALSSLALVAFDVVGTEPGPATGGGEVEGEGGK